MIEDVNLYLSIVGAVVVRRESGPLSQDIESDVAQVLDRIWWLLTNDEQTAVEDVLKSTERAKRTSLPLPKGSSC